MSTNIPGDPNLLRLYKDGGKMRAADLDQNQLNLARFAGVFDPAKVPYAENRVVKHMGFCFIADRLTSETPSPAAADWTQLTGTSGLGGAFMTATSTPGAAIGAGWNHVTYYDAERFPERGMTVDLAGDTFQIHYPGIWQISTSIIFEHTGVNNGRLCGLRLFNVTDSSPIGEIITATGRNAEATTFTGSILFSIVDTNLDDVLRFEIGGYDSYASVVYRVVTTDFLQVGA